MNFENKIRRGALCLWILLLISLFLAPTPRQFVHAQSLNTEAKSPKEANREAKSPKDAGRNRDMALGILHEMKSALKENYYDPKYRGIDLDARFKAAEARIKTLDYNWQMFRVLAQVLIDFDDSHTRLQLPPRADNFEYGFAVQMIGSKCYIVSVKTASDAAAKGLHVGDQVLKIGKFTPTRNDLWKMMYVLYKLDPLDTVDLKVKTVDGVERDLSVKAKTMTADEKKKEQARRKKEKEVKPFKCQEISPELIACKLYTFMVGEDEIDKMMKQVRTHSKLILDLRGNGGGYVSTEEYLTGYLFDHDVKIADMVLRDKHEVRQSRSKKDKVFKGDLIVLIDSRSASAAEIVARVVQIEKRGKIVGDVSSGMVMTSVYVPFFSMFGKLVDFISYAGMSMTIADVIMSDGSRLEHVGVIPDLAIGPTAAGLARKSDPVLAQAASMLGAQLTSEKAGEFYFLMAKPEDDDDSDSNAPAK